MARRDGCAVRSERPTAFVLALLALASCEGSRPEDLGARPAAADAQTPSLAPDLAPAPAPTHPLDGAAPPAPDLPAPCDDKSSLVLEPDPRVAQADALLAKSFGGNQPGVAALVILGGKVLLKKGYGLADLATGAPITPCSNFDLASVSKHFTAAAVLLLVQEGKLSLEDPVKLHLPELVAGSAANPIRIRHLLHQTSGLADYLVITQSYTDAQFSALTTEDVLALVKSRPLDFATGSTWAYSNTNYSLAALIVERVTKLPFSRFQRDRFFAPLGMQGTLAFDESAGTVPRRVNGYYAANGKFAFARLDGFIDGDGNVFTSVHDLVRWEAMWRGSPALLSAASVGLAYTSGKTLNGVETGYGFGWGSTARPAS